MKYLLPLFILFLSMNLSAQEKEHHPIPTDPEIREIFINAVQLMRDASIDNNRIKALEKFKEAAKLNDPTSQFIVGEMYEKGLGTAKNGQRALEWYKESAQNGDVYAMQRIGLIYKNGETVTQDFEKAVKWFKRSADAGNPSGKYFLAYMYYKGFGVKQNYKKAFELTSQSAETGITAGKHLMAYCYEHGHGVLKNLNKAEKLYTECNKKGYAQSKVRLEKVKKEKQKQNGKKKSATVTENNLSHTNPLTDSNFKEVIKDLDAHKTQFNGKWVGALFLYDWGKTQIEEKSEFSLEIKQSGFNIAGSWDNGQNQPMPFSAIKVGNILYCKNILIKREGSLGEPTIWEVNEGQLELIDKDGKTYLVGNLKMHNSEINEPGQPSYFILTNSLNEVADNVINKEIIALETNAILNNYVGNRNVEFTCYPNPTTNSVTIDYQLLEGGNTQISLINTTGQHIAVIKSKAFQAKGRYSVLKEIKGKPGNYIVKLVHNNNVYTRSIIKH